MTMTSSTPRQPGFLLETERMRLRPIAPGDLAAAHAMWTTPGVRRYLFDDVVVSVEQAREHIARSEMSFARDGYGLWVAEERANAGVLIGFCGYLYFFDPPELELIYGIDPPHWGRGLATELALAMMRFGFERCRFERVFASADSPNRASLRVMERAGMAYDCRRDLGVAGNTRYVMTRDRWLARE
jgi:ribosomal-protein-alanine N-acetyltransferase